MVAPFWDAEHGGEEVRLLFFSPPPPFGGNLLVGRNPFFEIPFAGLPPTFEAGFRCWGTITKVFATSGMRNRLGHTPAWKPVHNKSLKRRNPKYQSIEIQNKFGQKCTIVATSEDVAEAITEGRGNCEFLPEPNSVTAFLPRWSGRPAMGQRLLLATALWHNFFLPGFMT